jgi:hypothetical protein
MNIATPRSQPATSSSKPCWSWLAIVPACPARKTTMITALKKLYEEHARNCFHEAASVGDPRRRELLLKLAREWTKDAERLGVDAID